MNKFLREAYLKNDDKDFNAIVESMKRKAAKGLINESVDDIEAEVEAIFALDKAYAQLEEEVDEALEKYSYMIEE